MSIIAPGNILQKLHGEKYTGVGLARLSQQGQYCEDKFPELILFVAGYHCVLLPDVFTI